MNNRNRKRLLMRSWRGFAKRPGRGGFWLAWHARAYRTSAPLRAERRARDLPEGFAPVTQDAWNALGSPRLSPYLNGFMLRGTVDSGPA